MNQLIEQRKGRVAEICRRFHVKRLYLFGSATTDRFDSRRSDLDFLALMGDRQPTGDYADRVLGLADALERLFGRHIDLVTEESIRNPYFRSVIEDMRQLVYEGADQEAAA